MKKLNIKAITFIGMMVAAHIVLSRFLSINAWNIKIGFSFVPVFAAAYFAGPMAGALVGGLGDFLGAILFPIGPYFPGFTLTCALPGVVYGVFLHKKQGLPQILCATALNQFGISLFVTTYWISFLYGSPYWPLLVTRIVQAGILFALETVVILALSKSFSAQVRYLHA